MKTFGLIVMILLMTAIFIFAVIMGIKVVNEIRDIIYFKKHHEKRPHKEKKKKNKKDTNEADL